MPNEPIQINDTFDLGITAQEVKSVFDQMVTAKNKNENNFYIFATDKNNLFSHCSLTSNVLKFTNNIGSNSIAIEFSDSAQAAINNAAELSSTVSALSRAVDAIPGIYQRIDNLKTDFSELNDTTYPSTKAVDTALTGVNNALTNNLNTAITTVNAELSTKVPKSRTVNTKPLSADINLERADIDTALINKITLGDTSVNGETAGEADITNLLDARYAKTTDLPTVNTGNLIIQQNGTTLGTFNANASGDLTVNIEANESESVTVDSALSTTSENPVQNKVLTSKINELQSGIDGKVATSTFNSSVTAINTALDNKANSADVYIKSESDTHYKLSRTLSGLPADNRANYNLKQNGSTVAELRFVGDSYINITADSSLNAIKISLNAQPVGTTEF